MVIRGRAALLCICSCCCFDVAAVVFLVASAPMVVVFNQGRLAQSLETAETHLAQST